MGEPYREGHEYVVCDECGSHILIEERVRRLGFDEDDDQESTWMGFTCDSWECEADFTAIVFNPYLEPPALLAMDGGEVGTEECGAGFPGEPWPIDEPWPLPSPGDGFDIYGGHCLAPAPRVPRGA